MPIIKVAAVVKAWAQLSGGEFPQLFFKSLQAFLPRIYPGFNALI
jgi:hypothetical protein